MPAAAPLAQVRDDREVLLDPEGKDLMRFRLVQRVEMGQARKDGGRNPGFIQSVLGLIDGFYGEVAQQVTPWAPKAPKARRPVPKETALVDEPIEDESALDEAIDSARDVVAEETGSTRPRREAPSYVPGKPYPPAGFEDFV